MPSNVDVWVTQATLGATSRASKSSGPILTEPRQCWDGVPLASFEWFAGEYSVFDILPRIFRGPEGYIRIEELIERYFLDPIVPHAASTLAPTFRPAGTIHKFVVGK